ncbi:acyltransferase [Hydrogenophaga sp.]|uniref:acyltransferase n=2 Tax=Hydrogenophaga sp. TaxID=1904254 RepID=UPI0025C03619|nr:acyltransferase [Hydrogenophaga sp.]
MIIHTSNRLSSSPKKYLFDIFFSFQASSLIPIRARPFLWRIFGINLGKSAYIGAGLHILNKNKSIGNYFVVGYGGYFDSTGSIVIGDRVHIGAKSIVLSATHKIMPSIYRRDRSQIDLMSTKIGHECWIGTGVTLPGVAIGDGCVIGSGAVVTSDCLQTGCTLESRLNVTEICPFDA